MNTAKKLSIRLEAVGGDKVRQEFKNIGSDGQKAFQRITQVITPANDNLKVLDNTAKAFNNTLKQVASLAGAYLGLRGLTSAFKGIVQTNKEFESLIGSLKTVTGSAKGAQEIEVYLKSIGLVNFGGAMKEQIDTIGGAMSNIEDAISKLVRLVGENGLNKALKETFLQFNELLDGSAEAPAQATPERRPVGRAKRVNPVAPTKNQTCPLGRFCFWIGKPGSSLRSRFSRSVSGRNGGGADYKQAKPLPSIFPTKTDILCIFQRCSAILWWKSFAP